MNYLYKSLIYLLLVMCLLVLNSCIKETVSPALQIESFKLFGNANGDQTANDMIETASGFMIIGTTESSDSDDSNGKDVYIVKTNSEGNLVEDYAFGGLGDQVGVSIAPMPNNNGYVIVANEIDRDESTIWIQRINSNGDSLGNILKLRAGGREIARKIIPITSDNNLPNSDGSFLIVGSTSFVDEQKPAYDPIVDTDDVLLARIDMINDMPKESWSRIRGFEESEIATDVIELSDGGYAVLGTSSIFTLSTFNDDGNILFLKANEYGIESYLKSFGDMNTNISSALGMDANGNFLLTGLSRGNRNSELLTTLKIDENTMQDAVLNSIQTIGGTIDVEPLQSGDGYMLLTTAQSSDRLNGFNLKLIELNSEGIAGGRNYEIGGEGDDEGASIMELSDGSFAVLATIGFGRNRMIGWVKVK